MKLAVASGKGGTGKTSVAAALAAVWAGPVAAVDLDVETPNLHLFLRPDDLAVETAFMTVPDIDEDRCTRCGACADLCQYKAIAVMGDVVMTFPEMCHGCGGCARVCKEDAVRDGKRELGEIRIGRAGRTGFAMGRLCIGEAMSPPLIRKVKQRADRLFTQAGVDVILDCPPGVSCPAVTAVSGADAILLVTEPTPFGLHDLKLAVEAFTPMQKPMAVLVNRDGVGDGKVYDYCRDAGLPVLARIPFDRELARGYTFGRLITDVRADMPGLFQELAENLRTLATSNQTEKEAAL